ncbi:hypothetical protein BDF19DRAFT_488426 [Syncephalis fuscata]|nr:hypothetical protein BDF19DRAFT_488426 [Syncephalis fuscata]
MTPRGPVLHQPIEPLADIKGIGAFVVASGFSLNDKGREVSTFVLAVEYVHFVKLDASLKHKQPRKILNAIGKLPEKSLFTGHAPQKVDQRKAALEIYLQAAIATNPPTVDALCSFLSTNVKYPDKGITPEGYKEGYLTKRGKNFGGWKKRYFMLRSPVLEYYESREGQRLGTIPLRHCQVMRQQPRQRDHDEKAYRHAFMIIEARKNSNRVTKNVIHGSTVYHVILDNNNNQSQHAQAESIDSLGSGSTGAEDIQVPTSRGKLRKMSKSDTSNCSNQPFAESKSSHQLPVVEEKVERRSPLSNVAANENDNTDLYNNHSVDLNHKNVTSAPTPVPHSAVDTAMAHQPNIGRSSPVHHSTVVPDRDIQQHHSNAPISHRSAMSLGREADRRELPPAAHDAAKPTTAPPPPQNERSNFYSSSSQVSTLHKAAVKKKGFWGRMFTGGEPGRRVTNQPVFGVPLERAIEISRVKEGFDVQQLFIVPLSILKQNKRSMKKLREKYDTYNDYNLVASGEYYDVHAVAGVLKMYLRELPINVLTRELHSQFLKVLDNDDRRIRVNELGKLVSQLPVANYTLLRTLIAHLIRIVRKSDVNKMTIRNVGIVFSPTLNIPAGVFALFMAQFDYIFFIDTDGVAKPRMVAEGEELLGERVEATKHRVIPPSVKINTERQNHIGNAASSPRTPTTPRSMDIPMEIPGSHGASTSISSSLPVNSGNHLAVLEERSASNGRSKRNSLIYQSVAPELVQLERPLDETNHYVSPSTSTDNVYHPTIQVSGYEAEGNGEAQQHHYYQQQEQASLHHAMTGGGGTFSAPAHLRSLQERPESQFTDFSDYTQDNEPVPLSP